MVRRRDGRSPGLGDRVEERTTDSPRSGVSPNTLEVGLMDFGVVLQTTPPSARVVDLAKTAETYGFTYVWTFDSHILWQEPYVIYSQILAETRNVIVGPMVTNPATRDWTVTASVYATLNEMFGNRTVCGIGRGDSAVRVTNGAPTHAGHAARERPRHPRAGQRAQRRRTRDRELRFPWASSSALEVWVAAYGPKALALTGEVGDGFILQLADLSIAEWTIGAVRDAAAAAGRDPADDHHLRRRAGVRHRRHGRRVWPTGASSAAGSAGWSATTSPTSSPATATETGVGAAGADRLHQGPRGLRLQRARPGRQRAHRSSCPTRSSIGSASSVRSSVHIERMKQLKALGVDQFCDLPAARRQGPHPAGLRREGHAGRRRARQGQGVSR